MYDVTILILQLQFNTAQIGWYTKGVQMYLQVTTAVDTFEQAVTTCMQLGKWIPYSGKLSREKTFAKTASIRISWRKLSRVYTIHRVWLRAHAMFAKKTFANGHVSTKVFSLESFPLYGNLLYSVKLSREKTFANFVDLGLFVTVLFAKSLWSSFRESFLPLKFPAIR